MKSLNNYPRTEPEIPLDVSIDVLTNPKAKNSSAFLRTMKRSRERAVEYPRTAPKSYQARVNAFAQSRSVVQLCRLLRRYPRRFRTLLQHRDRVARLLEAMPTSTDLQQRVDSLNAMLVDISIHHNACDSEYKLRIGGPETTAPASI